MTGQNYISREEAAAIALSAAKEAVRETMTETFALLGVNIADFNAVKALRSDLMFLSAFKESTAKVRSKFFMTIVVLIASGFAISVWEWFKSMLRMP